MDFPDSIPVMMLPNATLFPHTMLPLFIFEPRYQKMLDYSLASHRLFAVALRQEHSSQERPHSVAGLGMIRAAVKHEDGTSHIILEGLKRVQLKQATSYRPYRTHRYQLCKTQRSNEIRIHALREKLVDLIQLREQRSCSNPPSAETQGSDASAKEESKSHHLLNNLTEVQDIELLGDLVASTLISHIHARQTILSELSLEKRLNQLVTFLMAESFGRKNKGSA